MIDLHVHSIFSDGSLSPEALVDRACEAGLTALSITDHDSTAGVARLMAACRTRGLKGIPGVEISAEVKTGTMHILGYFVDPEDVPLQRMLSDIRDGREIRNRQILSKLNGAGLALEWNEVAAFAGDDVVGRPHFAQAMLARKYVKSWEEAFDLYLAKGKAAYVDRLRLSPADSVRTVCGAGGVAVLAHPSTLDLDEEALRRCVVELRGVGLVGVEALYPEHTAMQEKAYARLAAELGMVVTGGSDFHGAINPDIRMGVGFGSLQVPDSVVDELEKRRPRAAAG